MTDRDHGIHKRLSPYVDEPAMNNEEQDFTTEAWTIDAHSYLNAAAIKLIGSAETDRFLSNQNVFGIVAAKGMGKTFLLRRKSQLLRKRESGMFVPRYELCEKFDRLSHDFSRESIGEFGTPDAWKMLWCTAIASVVLYGAGGRLSATLANILNVELELEKDPVDRRVLTIEAAVSMLLNRRIGEYRSLYTSELKPELSVINRNVFVFLDNLDEALDKHTGVTLQEFDAGGAGNFRRGALSGSVWINAQLGLLAAIRDLWFANRRLRVYAALRKEAIDLSDGALTMQERDLCCELSYSKALVEQIFIANIAAMKYDRLERPEAQNPYEKFVGHSVMPHWRVQDRNGRYQEHVFDFLYRHTFGRPRELLQLGKDISELPPGERSLSQVRDTVSRRAHELYIQYKREMIPYWDEQYDELLAHLNSNVLSERIVRTLFEQFERDFPAASHPFSYFIARGLIGALARKEEHGEQIAFRSVATYMDAPITQVGQSRYYFLHPCLESSVRERNAEFTISSRQVVGHGYSFVLEPEADILHISYLRPNRFVVEFRGVEVELSERSTVVPIFVAMACVVARSHNTIVPFNDLICVVDELIQAQLVPGLRNDQPMLGLIQERLAPPENGENLPADNDLMTINRAFRQPQGDGWPPLCVHAYREYCEFLLCAPEKVDVVQILDRISRAASSAALKSEFSTMHAGITGDMPAS